MINTIKVKDAFFIDAIPQSSATANSVYVQIQMSQEYARIVIGNLQKQLDECATSDGVVYAWMFGDRATKPYARLVQTSRMIV